MARPNSPPKAAKKTSTIWLGIQASSSPPNEDDDDDEEPEHSSPRRSPQTFTSTVASKANQLSRQLAAIHQQQQSRLLSSK